MTPTLASKFIALVGWGFTLFGVVFVSVSFAGADGAARFLADLFDWTGTRQDGAFSRDARWFGSIFAGLSVGFGLFYALLVAPLLRSKDEEARQLAKRAGLIAGVSWWFIDSLGSYMSGVPSNVVLNTLFLIGICVPLLLVKFDSQT